MAPISQELEPPANPGAVHIDTVGHLWASYIARGVTRIVNEENDTMYKGGKDWCWSVGESGARLVCVNLAASPLKVVKRVLDFGCGWGRVGRHLRALFPSAELLFCELNKPAAAFCAETFNGTVVSEADLPTGIDIIPHSPDEH